jgi:hypothetical protein
MSYIKQLFYPKLNSKPTKLWNIHQLSRAVNRSPGSVKRYMSYANIKADVYKPIDNRNNHLAKHYNQESVLKFFEYMASGIRGKRK